MIDLGADICGHLDTARQREWLETNGLGGFASSTISGLNTRRYHGLLTAALTPPVGRYVLLSKLEETLRINDQRFELATNQYPGVIHPQGYQYLTRFRLDPFPIATYIVAGVTIEKSVYMLHGENSTVIHYAASAPCVLEVRALIAFRDYHSTTHANDALNPRVEIAPGRVTVEPYRGLPALHCAHDAEAVDATGFWYYHFAYEVERERGLDAQEDLFSPFALHFDFKQRREATIIASTVPHDIALSTTYRQAEIVRRQDLHTTLTSTDDFLRTLVDRKSVV